MLRARDFRKVDLRRDEDQSGEHEYIGESTQEDERVEEA